MRTHTNHTIIYEDGKPVYAVLPYADYQKWLDEYTYIPHEIIKLITKYDSNLLGAWRRYRKFTKAQFAMEMGIELQEVFQLEQVDNGHSKMIEKAAIVLSCDVAQLTD